MCRRYPVTLFKRARLSYNISALFSRLHLAKVFKVTRAGSFEADVHDLGCSLSLARLLNIIKPAYLRKNVYLRTDIRPMNP